MAAALRQGDKPIVALGDPRTGKLRERLDGHAGPIYSLAFSRDGKTLACGSQDKTIKFWDIGK